MESLQSSDVMISICKFLDEKSKYLAAAINKHNVKNDRFQLIGKSCVATIGDHMIDCDLLWQAGVSKILWRVWDYASDKLMAKLYSYAMLKKLAEGIDEGKTVGLTEDICALASSFCMMTLHLHAVNGSFVPTKHRALYLFFSMLFFTLITDACMTTKQMWHQRQLKISS